MRRYDDDTPILGCRLLFFFFSVVVLLLHTSAMQIRKKYLNKLVYLLNKYGLNRNIQPFNIDLSSNKLHSLHGLDNGVYCHCSPLTQARTASGSSGNGNGGVGRNDCGVEVETESVAATVETMAATAAKLRRLWRKRYW